MIPETIRKRLRDLDRRRRVHEAAAGAGRWAALGVGTLAAGALSDWLIDLWTDTPWGLRAGWLAAQALVWLGAWAAWVGRPLLARRSWRDLALWAEDRFPEFGDRLITAVELNAPGARTEGMSAELLGAVTRQAEDLAARTDLRARLDRRPLRRGGVSAAAAAAVAAGAFLAAPETSRALLARQFLGDRAIPRSVALEPVAERIVWPAGEEVALRFRARGRPAWEGLRGWVRLESEGRPSETYALSFESAGPEGAVFSARIPPQTGRFVCRARLGDGRTRRPAELVYEPRPVVTRLEAALILPEYCGLRPDGSRYEQARPRGDVAGPAGSAARVRFEAQKALARAAIELLGRPPTDLSSGASAKAEGMAEPPVRRIELPLRPDRRGAEGMFDLKPEEVAYRVVVEDDFGFGNAVPPKRSLVVVPDEPPRVLLLPERFGRPGEEGLSEESEVEGMPVPLGSAIRIAYYAAHPYGLDRARLVYRVVKARASGEVGGSGLSEAPWIALPLKEVRGTPEAGPFDLRLGLFRNSGFRDVVEFHPLPSPDPERLPGRTEGGGSFDFHTKAVADLQVGDQIEFAVEVFARNPALGDQPGRSEARAKAVVTQAQFVSWVLETLGHERRIRRLEERQRGVFAPEGTDR
jgi:hypothetical protein